MLEALDEMKEYQGATVQQKYDILAVDLELFDIDGNKDPFEAFKKLTSRRVKQKRT